MIPYDHTAVRPHSLPLFPAPYPGESFYSVLCRYHVRSGNISDLYTTFQLFGYKSSLHSTLLTPFHLEMIDSWVPSSSRLDSESMLHQNTAFNLYGIGCVPCEIEHIHDVIHGRQPAMSFPRQMHPKIAHHAGFLRFCPKCAEEQRKLYGEPYWQLLPQIDEVEYCPRHKVRIRNSPVSLKSIAFHYHPASSVLTPAYLSRLAEETEGRPWEFLFREEEDFFIRLSRNIDWLLQNGAACIGLENLARAYDRVSGKDRRYHIWCEISRTMVRYAFQNISGNDQLYSYLKYKNPKHIGDNWYSPLIDSLRVCSHVMVMTALCGDPKTFYGL